MNARRVFYQPWEEGDHIFTFSALLGKRAKLFWKAKIPISEIDKVQHFVEQMIDRKCFTEKELVGYGNMDEGKKTWIPTYDYFTDLYETRTSLLEDFGAHSNYGSDTSTND